MDALWPARGNSLKDKSVGKRGPFWSELLTQNVPSLVGGQ